MSIRAIQRKAQQDIRKSVKRRLKDVDVYAYMYKVKRAEIMRLFKKDFKREAQHWVPRWAAVLSLFFPPRLYSAIFFSLWRPQRFVAFNDYVMMQPWGKIRKYINIFCCNIVFNVVKWLCHDWLLYIRMKLRAWRMSVQIYERNGSITQDIYYGREKIYSRTEEITI